MSDYDDESKNLTAAGSEGSSGGNDTIVKVLLIPSQVPCSVVRETWLPHTSLENKGWQVDKTARALDLGWGVLNGEPVSGELALITFDVTWTSSLVSDEKKIMVVVQ